MYMKRMLEIGMASNGFVVECSAAIKPKKGKDKEMKELSESYPCSRAERQYVAKDLDELGSLVTAIIPLLDTETEYTSEDEFDAAFEEAVQSL